MKKDVLASLKMLLCVLMVVLLVGCGTIMYPNRVGQRGGNIDAGVVVMDGLCLLLFVVPGIVAFVVDFSNGAVYLPGGSGSMELKDMKKITFDPGKCDMRDIEDIVKKETGYAVDVEESDIKVYAFSSFDSLKAKADIYLRENAVVLSCR